MIERLLNGLIRGLTNLNNRVRQWGGASVVKFKSTTGAYHHINPVVHAKAIKPDFLKNQIEIAKKEKKPVKFVRCPGMHDYAEEGFLIRAHTDIHIKANSAGVVITTPNVHDPKLNAVEMDLEVVGGMAPIVEGVKYKVFKIPLPWGIFTEPGHSVHLIPALMHFPHLDKVFVYPGTVDYEEFHTANLIISPIRPCEFTIHAGDVILHALPFKRTDYHGICGKATEREQDRHRYGFPSRRMGYYRRMFHFKKTYTSEVQP
jgi:hypothetical protein